MSSTSSTVKESIEVASRAGELLIRAAAAFGTLSREDQMALDAAAGGGVIDAMSVALSNLSTVSDQLVDSLRRHPPAGFVGVIRTPEVPARLAAKDVLRSSLGDATPLRTHRPG